MAAASSFMNSALQGAGSAMFNDTIGLALQPLANQEQVNMDQQLTNSQLNANEALSQFNFNQQYDLWNKTNYPAQVQQMEKAGLNPALMYSGRGAGGSTTGSPSGGMGIGPNAPNMTPNGPMAQFANTQADTNLKNAQADNIRAQTPHTGDLMQAQIASINQGVQNQKAQQALTQAQTTTQNISNQIQGQTIDDSIASIRAAAGTVEQGLQEAVRNNWIDQNTMNDKIRTIHGIMLGQFIGNALQQQQTNLSKEQQTSIVNDIAQKWRTIEINAQNANTNEGQLKLQQLLRDVPDSKGMIFKAVSNLLPIITSAAL